MKKSISLIVKLFYKYIFFLFFSPLCSVAQHYNFKNISIENGLQSSFVYCSIEDDNGYVWFATEKGISRFDGVSFKYFGENEGLTESGYYQIVKDSYNQIWLISKNFKLFCYKNNRFKVVKTSKEICWIDIDKQEKIWFLSRSGDLFKIDINGELVLVLSSKSFGVHYSFKSLGADEFVLCSENEIYFVNKIHNKQKINIPIEVKKFHVVPRCFLRKNNSLLISNHEGIYEYKNSLKEKAKFRLKVSDNQIFSFFEDTFTNDIWLGSLKGVYQFKKGVIHNSNKTNYLKDNIILDIKRNSESGWWFCTSENGVFNSDLKATNFDASDGLKRQAVGFIKKDKDHIYAISLDGSISIIHNNKIENFSSEINGIVNSFQTQNDGIIISSSNLYQLKDNVINKFSVKGYPFELIHQFSQNNIRNFYFLSKSQLWKGFIRPKLLYFNMSVWHIAKKYKPNLESIYFLDCDSFHNMFYRVESGLIEFFYNQKYTKYKMINFPYNIKDVWKTSNQGLIIGTLDKGLCIIKNNKRKFYRMEDGLLSDYCTKTYFINNRIWVCSNKGVSRLTLDKNDSVVSISNFTSNDLLIYNEVNDLVIHKGDVYVATNKGVSVFPENIQLQSSTPKVFIENIQINNEIKSVLDEYTLEHTENNISIQYKSISFRSANNIFYKYKLVGPNDSSIVMTKLDRIQLSSLSPGNYTFTVWARNIDGVWSLKPATIVFIINPPFWLTTWFVLLMTGILSFFIFIYIKIRLKNFKTKNETAKRIIDAELKAIRLHMNPHFIFNTLSSLQYYILYDKNLEAGKYLTTFSLLLRLIMKYSRKNEILLSEEIDLLKKYVALEQMRFDDKIDFVLNIEESLMFEMIPPLILQPFVENSIKYGISNINEKGKLVINIEKEENYLYCSIQDNGIGRVKAEMLKNDKNLRFESTGIKYTLERLKLLSNNKKGKDLVIVTDLYERNVATGTLVEIRIPRN